MTDTYYPRTLGLVIERASRRFKAVMVTGMRQVGKSTLLKKLSLSSPSPRTCVTLDKTSRLTLAKEEPELFLKQFPAPAFIYEVQLAPELFRPLKAVVDGSDERGQYWLSGSQSFSLMRNVSDKLPGRLVPFHLWPLSVYERSGEGLSQKPYLPGPDKVAGKGTLKRRSPSETWQIIWQGAWPDVVDTSVEERDWFYRSLIDLYVAKDVVRTFKIDKVLAFMNFMRALAFLSGQELRLKTLAEWAKIDTLTVKRWLSVAESSGIIYLMMPFENNFGKQLVKSPKIYMTDTGLMAYLLDIASPGEMVRHQHAGFFFETFVVTEILKSWIHNGKTPHIRFLRENRGMEIDLIIRHEGRYYPVEIKTSSQPGFGDAKWLHRFESVGFDVGTAAVIGMVDEPYTLGAGTVVHSVWDL